FTGYWRLVKTENFNNFLKDLGLPWTVRKAALRFGSASVDLISHTGTTVKVTSLCAKGSWTREYDTAAAIKQRNAQGEMCATNARWEGSVLVSTMEGSPLGVATSARFMAGPTMVVKTAVRLASGRDAIMFWIFDRMQAVEERVSGPGGRPLLLRQLAADHAHVARATRRDNAYLQDRAARAGPAIQQQLAHKLVEFCEGRGISSVVPLASPGTAAEPQLLGMSPEQAEETAAKMSELEADMLLARQGAPRGWACCGLIITRRSTQIPDHLRVWEMNLAA
ncbi:hypothetical protein APUTEX25_004631, partial [Auxenochlorella protothecoides]